MTPLDPRPLAERVASTLGSALPHTLLRHSAASTTRLAARLATLLRGGDILALTGGLGAGKTCFVRGLCRALSGGAPLYITSPTYTIANMYDTQPIVAHLDLYRLANAESFLALGGEEYFAPEYLTVLEWADRIPEVVPDEAIWVHLEPCGDRARRITFSTTRAPRRP